jgi:hypothetical protein
MLRILNIFLGNIHDGHWKSCHVAVLNSLVLSDRARVHRMSMTNTGTGKVSIIYREQYMPSPVRARNFCTFT